MIFDEARLGSYLTLRDVSLSDTASITFRGSMLPDIIDFSDNRSLNRQVNLLQASLDSLPLYSDSVRRWHYLGLFQSDPLKVAFDYQHFRLCFFDADQEDHLIKDSLQQNPRTIERYLDDIFPWTRRSDTVRKIFWTNCKNLQFYPRRLSDDEIRSIIEQCLNKFQTDGQRDSYEALDIAYKNLTNGWFILPRVWNCYGYHKEWIFYWTFGLLLFFTAITAFFLPLLNRAENGAYHIDNVPDGPRLWASLAYTALVFFPLGIKIEKVNFKNRWGSAYIILVYSAGILCLGYLANFVLQK